MTLHKYTQEEFDALPENEYGGKICPTGDYTEISAFPGFSTFVYGAKFGDEAEFGNWATFGHEAEFGKNCSFEGDRVKNGTFVTVGRIGSVNRTAYFYIDENGKFFVRAGCWFSDEDSFIERVKAVHGGTIYETQYLAALDYAKAVLPGMLKEVNE